MDETIKEAASEVGVHVAEPSSTTQHDLELADPSQIAEGLYFVQRFKDKPNAVPNLQAEAKAVLPGFIQNVDSMVEYGAEVLDDVRRSGSEIRRLTGDVELSPEDQKAMLDLTMALKDAEQYDPTVAANVEKFQEMWGKLQTRFGKKKAQAYFAAFKALRMSIEDMVESMRSSLQDDAKHRKIVANAIGEHYDNLEVALVFMSERLAVLQIVRQMAVAERAKFPEVVETTDPNSSYVRDVEMFQRMLDLKIQTFAEVWFASVNMSPAYLIQQEGHTMMAFKLKVAAGHGMDLVEEILAQMAAAQDLMKDNQRIEQFESFQNDMLLKVAKQTRTTLVTAARLTTSSSLTAATITGMSTEFAGLIGDVRQVYREAAGQHDAKMKAIVDGVAVIEQAQANKGLAPIDPALVQGVVQSRKGLRSITG